MFIISQLVYVLWATFLLFVSGLVAVLRLVLKKAIFVILSYETATLYQEICPKLSDVGLHLEWEVARVDTILSDILFSQPNPAFTAFF